jgi:Sec-independent protein translocase protein TatA
MLDLSFWEIFVIAMACLIFLKPEDIPGILREGGKLFRKLKKTMNEFTSSINLDEDKNAVKPRSKILGLDGKHHDAYDVKEVFKEDIEIKPEDEREPK